MSHKFTMGTRRQYSRTNKGESKIKDWDLDPQLWQKLPKDILQRVMTKLPFSKVVAFRSVCKDWYLEIIPSAAPQVEASSGTALLYFGLHKFEQADEESLGSPWWLKICDPKSHQIGDVKDFQPRSFPLPQRGEDVILMDSQEGLLFFGFVSRGFSMMRDIVVCNPLTSNSRSLGLPSSLKFWPSLRISGFLSGVVFDTKAGHYKLVAAGMDREYVHATHLYSSYSCTWTEGSPLLPALLESGLYDNQELNFESQQGVPCKGNLYWNVNANGILPQHTRGGSKQFVFEFDIQEDSWRIIPVDLDPRPCLGLLAWPSRLMQMISFEGEVMVGHLHLRRLLRDAQNDENCAISVEELFGPNYVRPPRRTDWPCLSNLQQGLDPGLKMMHHDMMKRLDGYLALQAKHDTSCTEYSAFSHQHVIYHVFLLVQNEDRIAHPTNRRFLKIVAHNTSDNSYTELCPVSQYRCLARSFLSASDVWSFSPSLTALP